MKPIWLIETGVWKDGNVEKMIALLRAQGLTVHAEDYTCMGGTEFEAAGEHEPIIYYGSLNTAEYLHVRHRNWVPFIWFDSHIFSCQSYYAHWGRFLLQEHYAFYPLGELARLKGRLIATHAKDSTLFIRPNDNDKSFNGRLITASGFDAWYQEVMLRQPDLAGLAMVAAPVKIEAEWRLVIADRKVIAGSHYKSSGKVTITNERSQQAARLAAQIAADAWQPRAIYCVDIALTSTDDYRLVEIGGINSAGLYHCPLQTVVQAMNDIAIREYKQWKGLT